MKYNSVSNILFEQNNIFAVTCNYQNVNKHGNLNTSYFNFHNSIVSVDLDSKNYNLSSGYRKQFSNIYKLAFGNKESLRFNILDEIEEETAYSDAFEIANILTNNMHDIRDFLIMIILHVKCSNFKLKTLCGCFDFLLYYTNDDDSINNLINIFNNIENSYHCTSEIHEIVRTNSKRFKNMSKNMEPVLKNV